MRLLLFYFSVILAFPALSLGAIDYFELNLGNLESSQTEFPPWLIEVTETGGELKDESGWQVKENRPFGIGKLFLTLDRSAIEEDLALTFTSPDASNIAIQLYDSVEQILAVDLLAERLSNRTASRSVTTVVIPLNKYPTARHIVLRRLDGLVEIPYVTLLPLTYPVSQNTSQIHDLAKRFGDPTSPDNPYVKRINKDAGGMIDPTARSTESLQPIYAMALRQQKAPLSEKDLLAILQVLGLQGYDFNAFDFVRAAGEGREEVVALYLRAGMPINVQGDNKYTAVAEAASSGELRVLKLLTKQGADLEIRTAGGNTALWMACCNSKFEAIRLLVEAGADVNALCVRGETPLNILIQWRYKNKEETLAAVKYLMEHDIDTEIRDDSGRTLLHVAIEEGWTGEVREVLRHQPDLEARNNLGLTPMMVVEYRNNTSIKNLLLKARAKPWVPEFESKDDELVFRIHRREYQEALRLIAEGAEPNISDLEGNPIAFRIVRHHDINLLKRFMEQGMRLDVRDKKNQTLLDAQSGSFKELKEAMVAFLLEQGLDPNYATKGDLNRKKPYWTPLMKAANSGNAHRCRALLKAGADPTIRNLPRRTAAIVAERAGYIQLASELRAAEESWEANTKSLKHL